MQGHRPENNGISILGCCSMDDLAVTPCKCVFVQLELPFEAEGGTFPGAQIFGELNQSSHIKNKTYFSNGEKSKIFSQRLKCKFIFLVTRSSMTVTNNV